MRSRPSSSADGKGAQVPNPQGQPVDQPVDNPGDQAGDQAGEQAGGPRKLLILRRRFLLTAALGAGLAIVIFLGVMQASRQSFFSEDLLGNFYDGQAQALLAGHMNVDPNVPGFEGFRIGEETHIYQGIVPAVVRMPVLALTSRFEGRLTGLSMLLAYCAALGFLIFAAWRIRCIMRGSAAMGRAEMVCTATVAFGIAGSSLLFLSSTTWVYHEALLWGAALCIGSFTSLIYWMAPCGLARPTARFFALFAAVLLGGLAVNTRLSIGLGPLVGLGLAAGCLVVDMLSRSRVKSSATESSKTRLPLIQRISGWDSQQSTSRPLASLLFILVGVAAAVVVYAGVNNARFHSWFGVPLDRQVLVAQDPARVAALQANGNSLFGVKYAPSVLLQTLRPDALALRSEFPFIGFPSQKPAVLGDALFAERDWSSSLPASEPLLFFGSLIGLTALFVPKKWKSSSQVMSLRIPVLGAAAGGSLFLAFGYISQRYLTDLFPFLALSAVIGLQALAALLLTPASCDRTKKQVRQSRIFAGIAVFAILVGSFWSVWVNSSLALQYGLEISPSAREAQRSSWLDLQKSLGGHASLAHLPSGAALPTPGPRGQVLIFGNCEAMYRSSGSIWYLLEAGRAAGGVQVRLTKTAAIEDLITLVQAASPQGRASLVLRQVGQDQAELLIESSSPAGLVQSTPSKIFALPLGHQVSLNVVMTSRTNTVLVTEQHTGRELLREQVEVSGLLLAPVAHQGLQVKVSDLPTKVCRDISR
ncbi:MAG: hypothetical protein WCJ04_03665 [Actinomycetes bacterium]